VFGEATGTAGHYRLWSTNDRAERAVEADAWIR
jgi:hypothetical protein